MRLLQAPPFSRRAFLLLSLTVFVVALIALGGCQQAGSPSALVSPQGVKVEKLFPADGFAMVKIGASDENQLKMLDQLAQYFPKGGFAQVTEQIVTGFNSDMAKYGMTYENDVKPFLGEHPQFMLAVAGQSTANRSPDLHVAVTLANPAQYDAFMEKLLQQGKYQKDTYKNVVYYVSSRKNTDGVSNGTVQNQAVQDNSVLYFARLKDVAVAANRQEGLQFSIDHLDDEKGSLLASANYQKTLGKLPSSLGFFYFDVKNLMTWLKSVTPASSSEVDDVFKQMSAASPLTDAVQGEFYALSAEQKGFRVQGMVFGDEEILKKTPENFMTYYDVQTPYLYQQVPSSGAIFYGETSNLKKMLDYDFKLWDAVEKTKVIHESVNKFFAEQGLNFDNDVLALFDKGSAFVMRDSGGFVPGIGVYVDAGSHPDSAQKVMNKWHDFMKTVLFSLKTELGDIAAAIQLDDLQVKGGPSHVVRLALEKLPKEQAQKVPPFLAQLKPEFWYGTTAGQLLFMALNTDFDQQLGSQVLANDADFKAVRDAVGGTDQGGFFYFSPKNLVSYINRMMLFVAPLSGASSADLKDFELFKSYVNPVKAVMFRGHATSISEARMDGFMLLGQ